MAVVADVQTVSISINDIEVQVPKGELIVESVKRLGLEIPIFCYHSRLKPVGMCRMCLVEVGFKQPDGSVRKMPKPQAACTLPASEGMAVYTDTEAVHKDRKGVLEFLLINHPLDCPICDRGGECPLQNNTLFYGPSTSRFLELKRHLPKAFPLSQYVTLDLERCIQCGRCVRFTEEISGDAELAFRFRGAEMQPSTFEMTQFASKFSGNVIEICPVGALTSTQYRFRARPWDLETRAAICTLCSNGCNVWFDHRAGRFVRLNGRTNEAVNEEWTCDKGKFGHDFYNSQSRLTVPLLRREDRLEEVDWPTAYTAILEAFQACGNSVAALAGTTMLSNEDLYLLKRSFATHFGSGNVDHRFERTLPKGKMGEVQDTLADFEAKAAILLFGTSLADEEPILFLRVRKAWFQQGTPVIVAHHEPTDADAFAHTILRYRKGTEIAALAALRKAIRGEALNASQLEAETGLTAAKVQEAAELLKRDAACVTTRALYDLENPEALVRDLRETMQAVKGTFNLFGLRGNDQGAEELGLMPEGDLDTHGILQACAEGKIRALWLAGLDLFQAYPDRVLVEKALENVEFLVVQGPMSNESVPYASVALPSTAPAEMDGTYTNLERRVQRMKPVLRPKGEAKPTWKIFSELGLRLKSEAPFFNAGEIMAEIAREIPAFAGMDYDALEGEGRLLN